MKEKATVNVWRIPGAPKHPYPWMFSVTFQGKTHRFAGIPNQCETKRAASMRGRWRARWLEDGSFAKRYQ